MKSFQCLFLLLLSVTTGAQTFNINATRFLGGEVACGANARNGDAVSTNEGGIVFAGLTDCWDGDGEIPPSLTDTNDDPYGNVLVGKLDSNMNVVWVKVFGGSGYDAARGIVQTPDGGYAVLASTNSNDNDVSGSHGPGDLWLIRLDAGGNLLWQKCYGSAYDEQAISIALAPDNGFIMFGVSNGIGGDVPAHYSGSEFDYDWFVVKTDDIGTVQWTKSIGGLREESFYGKMLAEDGGYYLVSTSASHDHDCTDTTWHPGISDSEYDYYIFKLDLSGNILWCKSYGGSLSEEAFGAIWDSRDESINIIGYTQSNDYMVTGHIGDVDMWLMKADKNGIFKWGKCLGSVNYEEGHGIGIIPQGYCIAGLTTPGINGVYDNWVFAVDMNGNEVADKQFGGSGNEFPSKVLPFKQGQAIFGASVSSGFSEGVNLGHFSGKRVEIFISYLDFWPLDVQEISAEKTKFRVFPDPATNFITIRPSDLGHDCNIIITDVMGRQLFSGNTGNGELNIDVRKWGRGIYYATLGDSKGNRETKKVLVN